jgi:2,4-diketo-3-deoxy-L-fuconate hydrolase
MKLLRCVFDDGPPRPGLRRDDGSFVDLTAATVDETDDQSIGFTRALERLAREGTDYLVAAVSDAPEAAVHPSSAVTVVAPLASSGRFIALGDVYTDHLREGGHSLPSVPAQWLVPKTAVVGPEEPIVVPERVREAVTPAVELCLVIGRGGRDIDEADAMGHVAGYTVSNDITAKTDWPGPMAYKLLDTFSPCGPGVTPTDQVDDPTSLEMTLQQDGERICSGSSAGMRFSLPFIVRFLSSILQLRPGDVISVGDPGGVQEGLTVGSSISASIESVGQLDNPVTSPD